MCNCYLIPLDTEANSGVSLWHVPWAHDEPASANLLKAPEKRLTYLEEDVALFCNTNDESFLPVERGSSDFKEQEDNRQSQKEIRVNGYKNLSTENTNSQSVVSNDSIAEVNTRDS